MDPPLTLPKIMSAKEPTMSEQRPSLAAAQDISHVLNKAFGAKFARQSVDKETVSNLTTTVVPDDEYHENYVKRLAEVQQDRNLKIQKLASVERMIIQARAKAIAHYEKSLTNNCDVREYKSFMNSNMLREHDLIVPEDLFADPFEYQKPAKGSKKPNFSRSTASSKERTRLIPRDDGYSQTAAEIKFKEKIGMRSNNSSPEPADFQELMGPGEIWQDMPDASNRLEAKKYLSIMNARQEYLKNPANNNSLSPADPEFFNSPFKPVPSRLVFTKYSIGQAYEMTVELKNTSTCQRKVRVLPPKSNKFSVSLGSFPSDSGVIAPGLSCQYTVNFVPETLADCDDELTIQTEGFCDTVLPLQARRPPPVLTIGDVVDTGHCLVGGAKLTEFTFRNEGGAGCFFVLPKNKWPATGYKNFIHGGRIVESPFEIRPAMFQALPGAKITLEVLFVPKSLGKFEAEIMFVCDNCHVKQVTFVGSSELASVKLTNVSENSLQEPAVGESVDNKAESFIKFLPINPMTYAVRRLTVKNETQVTMGFSWQILKPFLVTPEADVEDNDDRSWDLSSPFSVSPNQAEIHAGSEIECSLVFAAPYANKFHNVLHLMLHNIPRPPDQEITTGVNAVTGGPAEKQIKLANESAKSSNSSAQSSHTVTLHDRIGLRIDVKGECIPYNVSFVPYSVDFVGKTLIGTTARKPFQMMNNSVAPVYFRWKPVNNDEHEIIEIEPAEGEIAEGYCASFEVALSRNKPGPIERNIICEIEHQELNPICLNLKADIQGPIVSIETDNVNFGLVRVNEVGRSSIFILNKSSVSAKWSFELNGMLDDSLKVLVPSGTLAPLGEFQIDLQYAPKSEAPLNVIGHLKIENGPESFIQIAGETQIPTLCLLKCEEDLGTVYLNVPVSTHAQLFNQTDLPTNFSWGEAKGADAEFCQIQVFPSEAVIDSRQTLDVEIQIMSIKLGTLEDLLIPCNVDGREKPIWLSVKGDVCGLNVEYSVGEGDVEMVSRASEAKDSEQALRKCQLQFESVTISEPVSQTFVIRNTTAIATEYQLRIQNFAANPIPDRVSKCLKAALNKGERIGLLKQTPHLADPYSITLPKAIEEYNAAVLRNDKGVAFTLSSDSGSLGPFGEVVIEVTCYSDMWGKYSDFVICNVGELEDFIIPITADVNAGCPISYQIMGALKVAEPIIRFGTKIDQSPDCTRNVQINNNSPVTITVYWQVFDSDSDPKKVIDLKMYSDRPFGGEIRADDSVNGGNFSDDESLPSERVLPSEIPPDMEVRDFLSLKVLSHNGVSSSNHFSMAPDYLEIAPRSNVKVLVTFSPHSPDGNAYEALGFCQGFLSLTNKDRVSTGVSRNDQYDVDPVRFWLSGFIKSACLTIELDDVTLDQGISLEGSPSLLLDGGKMKDWAYSGKQPIKLFNGSEANVSFQLFYPEFLSLWMKDREKKTPWVVVTDKVLMLGPQKHMELHAALKVTKVLIDGLLEASDEQDSNMIVEHSSSGGRIFKFFDKIEIRYSNDTNQEIPVNIQMSLPNLTIATTEFDFGSVFVGTSQQRELELVNKTGSGSLWRLEEISGSPGAAQFTVKPSAGYLAPFLAGDKNKVMLNITFECQTDEELSATYKIEGVFGEQVLQFTVRGNGSFDAHYQQND